MRYVPFGTTGLEVSAVAYGAMSLTADTEELGKQSVIRAYELGITLFDTADVYSNGVSEEILGAAMREGNIPRDKVLIASKCGIVFPGMEPSYEFKAYDLSAGYLKASCEQSLKRLGMDYLDLYQPHRIDYLAHPEEVAQALDELKKEGKLRQIGVSNYTTGEIRSLSTYTRLESLQTQFSLLHIEPLETGLHSVCLEKKMNILCWSPLHRGCLAGAKPSQHAEWQEQRELGVYTQALGLAERYGVTAGQISLAWLMQLPGGVIPLVGTANPTHLEEAVKATEVTLDRDDWYELMVIARGRTMPWYQRPYAYLKER